MSTFLLILYITKEVLTVISLLVMSLAGVHLIYSGIAEKKRVQSLEESIEAIAKFQKILENRIKNIEGNVKHFKIEVSSDCLPVNEV